MAREHARILTRIWRDDDDWRALPWEGQHMYLLLLSQPTLTHAGTLPLTLNRWSGLTDGRTSGDVEKVVRMLEDRRFVVADWDTEELLIRSFIRNDGVYRQPNVLKSAMRIVFEELESKLLKAAIAEELLRVGLTEYAARLNPSPNPPSGGGEPLPTPAPATPKAKGSPNPSRKGSEKGSGGGYTPPSDGVTRESRGRGEGGVVSSSSVRTSVSKRSAEENRDDVEGLCKHLRDRIVGNGSKAPSSSDVDGWRTAARLLVDRDKRDLDEAHRLIDWCQDHHFWRSNVLGMPKFRKQYDAIRLQEGGRHLRAVAVGHTPYKNVANQDEYDESPFPRKEKTL